jgi:nicotinamidase-related amidase
MMTDKSLLLIIDAQYDFCDAKGALYVPGAEKDMQRLACFIGNNRETLDGIILSQDAHQVMDISHPAFWTGRDGNHPVPFTQIGVADVENGEWISVFGKETALKYLTELDRQDEFPHVIWPEHCIEGSRGAAIVDSVMDEVKNWARTGKQYFKIIQKGKNPLTEHFGIMNASVQLDGDPDTGLNVPLLNLFAEYGTIYIAGEAQSHCVAVTVKQMMKSKGIADKLVILKNCMSPVPGFEHLADDIYGMLNPCQFIEV